jgi:hypothetical protein
MDPEKNSICEGFVSQYKMDPAITRLSREIPELMHGYRASELFPGAFNRFGTVTKAQSS